MNYWLSRSGGPASGPYGESQLCGMWHAGTVLAVDQVCPTDVDDAWMPISQLMDEIDGASQRAKDQERLKATRAAAAQAEYDRSKKSAGVALALSFLFPCGGQFYARRYWQASMGLLMLCIVAFLGFLFLAVLIWLASLADAPGSVNRFNRELASELGVL